MSVLMDLLQSKEMVTDLTVEDRSTGYFFLFIRNPRGS